MFRYPGGKKKLRAVICSKLQQKCNLSRLYVEPFMGTGAAFFELVKSGVVSKAALNDYDYAVTCVWNSVLKRPEQLKKLIRKHSPAVPLFYSLKEFFKMAEDPKFPIKEYEIEDLACKKILLHQMSYSGLGAMAGGPIGGKDQKSEYDVGCRWSPDKIIKDIDECHSLLKSVELLGGEIFHDDFRFILNKIDLKDSIIYLDPPYFEKGEELYLKSFNQKDHDELFDFLIKLGDNADWLLSYDNHEYIKQKYSKYVIETLKVVYSIKGANHTKEILISNY